MIGGIPLARSPSEPNTCPAIRRAKKLFDTLLALVSPILLPAKSEFANIFECGS